LPEKQVGSFSLIVGLCVLVPACITLSSYSNAQKKVEILFDCTNPLVSGVLTKLIIMGRKKDRAKCVETLIPLLYKIDKYQATQAFNAEEAQMLRNIAVGSYWRKHEPDLVAASLVALIALDDHRSKQLLKKLAARSWGQHKHKDAWVGEAARRCLQEWNKREGNP
jgi:hypothetical protein